VESDAHFVKSDPHFSDIHLRNAASHAFAVVMFVPPVAPVSPAASSNARCRRIVSASAAFDESIVDAPISDSTSLNWDVLLLTIGVVAACAIFDTAIIAKIESLQKIFKFVFILF
jgi:hypothetical protein